jgi:hypothetical protein
MSGAATIEDDEDKALSTLGSQSAFMSMLNMGILSFVRVGWLIRDLASKLGRDLPDIDDDEYSEDEDEDEDDRQSSEGITYGLFRLTY